MLAKMNCIMYVSYLCYLCGLSFASWQGICARLWSKRLYWIACSTLMLLGTIGMIYFFLYPDAQTDKAGCINDEMPPEFGLSAGLVYTGLLLTAMGAVWIQVWKVFSGRSL